MPYFLQVAIWIGTLLLVASIVAHMVRVPQFTWRVAAVLLVGVAAVAGLFPWPTSLRLGIDLSGGTILVYRVQPPVPADFDLQSMVAAINRRVNPAGLVDVAVRGIGNDRVELVIPRAAKEEVQRCKRVLTSEGNLEFRILANSRDHAALIRLAQAAFPKPVVENGHTLARWVPIAAQARRTIGEHGGVAIRSDPRGGSFVLVAIDELNVTGELLRNAEGTHDDFARPAVAFEFGPVGAARFGRLTEKNQPAPDGFERRLAILLDGEVYSAPNLRDRISEHGIITGDFSPEEVADLASILNAGSLPGALEKTPVSELTIGPTLGRDTIHSGLTAMFIATALVLLFMVAYYRWAGLVADVAVILNVLIVVGAMSWLRGTWTLAGLAGLALTIGMAVDANVLIFERLREEQQQGRTLRMAIHYAFARAFRPILDSNVTTLLAAGILYMMGSEQVRGFAVTLIIGLVANLFTAVFVCRLVFDILQKNGWMTRCGMAQIFRQPNLDFTGKRFLALGASLLMIVFGLAGVVWRGADLLDIDFTGGTLAAVRFRDATDPAEVRRLAANVLPDVNVEELQVAGEPAGHRFLIRTTMQDQDRVRTLVRRELGNLLVATRMTYRPIERPAEGPGSQPPATPAKPSSGSGAPGGPAGTDAAPARPAFLSENRFELSFDQPVAVDSFRGYFEESLAEQRIHDAPRHYRLHGLDGQAGKDGCLRMRLEADLDRQTLQRTLETVGRRLASDSIFERLDSFGSQIARETQATAAVALLAGMLAIVAYLWIRFQSVRFGLGAVVAVVHDVLVVLGLVALSRLLAGNFVGRALLLETFKINLPMIAAFLTLIGYSVNDTIVVFDRIRELRGRAKPLTWELINNAINQTLSRTLLTGLTTWVVALILYAVGGIGIHGFAFCLVAGVLVGTYSSIYVASPLLMWFGRKTTPEKTVPKEIPSPAPPKPTGQKPPKPRQESKHRRPKRPGRKAA